MILRLLFMMCYHDCLVLHCLVLLSFLHVYALCVCLCVGGLSGLCICFCCI